MQRCFRGCLVAFAALGFATPTWAFCRITTCDPAEQGCDRDDDGCLIHGEPLAWASSCVSIAIHENGSERHGVDAETLETLALQALGTWLRADCGGGRTPSIAVDSLGFVACGEPEYNASGNANIVAIRDEQWPYTGAANVLGKTHLVFEPGTGRIYDADIEINGADADLSVGDPVRGADLLSILTHEFGHFLGLDHSPEPSATMRAEYQPSDAALRTLAPDDVQGICAIYPPEREPVSTSCTPRHGFSAECGGNEPTDGTPAISSTGGCRFARASNENPVMPRAVLAFLVFALCRRRVQVPVRPEPASEMVAHP